MLSLLNGEYDGTNFVVISKLLKQLDIFSSMMVTFDRLR